jgi:lysophospholipid acyltransferase
MMITLKVISVGFNYSDGIDLRTKDVEHKRLSIQELPSLDSYFGYLFFYPSVMSGPIFEYKDYLIWANAVRSILHF